MKRLLVVATFLLLLPAVAFAQLSYMDTGTGINEVVTITSANQFKLTFSAADNWGLDGWYDLVNDPSATTNLALAYSVNGPGTPCFIESGLSQMTIYGDNDKKLFIHEAGCAFPNATRSLTILDSSPSRIAIQTSGQPMDGGGPNIDTNITGTVTYYIYPNGQIYVTDSIHATNAVDLSCSGGCDLLFGFMGLNDPAQTGTVPPDSKVGWIRATSSTNPWNNGTTANEHYLFAYWDPTTPAYGGFTKASIMLVLGPVVNAGGSTFGYAQIRHSWGCGTGCGTVRWGYRMVNAPNMAASQTITQNFLMQLGTQGSAILPNLTSSAVCDPIANAYRTNPNPPPPTASTPVLATVIGTHTLCNIVPNQTTFCFATDGMWQSLNGGTYTQVQ
jgi:hypothetical protein